MKKRERLQQYIECYEDEMYATGAHEVSREKQDMPPMVDANEDIEEATFPDTTVPASTSEIPVQSTSPPITTSTTESILRTEDQLIANTETAEPGLFTRGERVIDQPQSSIALQLRFLLY